MTLDSQLEHFTAADDAAQSLAGKWKNELGSTVTIVQYGSLLTGEYYSAVSEGQGTALGALIGLISGNVTSFTVTWFHDADTAPSITNWIGQVFPEDTKTLKMLWLMCKQTPQADGWESTLAGSDTFIKVG